MSEYFQRMRLVPYKWFEKYEKITENNDDSQTQTKKKNIEILDDNKLSDSKKLSEIKDNLRQYNNQILKKNSEELVEDDSNTSDHDNDSSEMQFDFLTPTQIKHAKSLLKRVREMVGFKLNEKGEVILRGTRLYGSNISELISDLIKSSKNSKKTPIYGEKFWEFLASRNIALDFIKNTSRRDFIKNIRLKKAQSPLHKVRINAGAAGLGHNAGGSSGGGGGGGGGVVVV